MITMSNDVYATFDSAQEVSVTFTDGSVLNAVRIIAARTGEHGQIIALIAKNLENNDVVFNWDNVTRVEKW
jgi:hypothetical protein